MNVGDQDGDGPADECHGECQQERWCHLVDKAGPATEDETFWHGKRVKKGFVHMFIVFNDCSVYLFWIIHYIILYFIILYYILLCHIALCYIILYNIVLYNITYIYIYITLWYIYIYIHTHMMDMFSIPGKIEPCFTIGSGFCVHLFWLCLLVLVSTSTVAGIARRSCSIANWCKL